MGSSWSRSKRVSPECAKADVSSPKHPALFRPLHIHGLLRTVRKHRAQQDRPGTERGEDRGREDRTNGVCRFSSEEEEGDAADGGMEQWGRASTEPRGAEHRAWSSCGPSVPRDCPSSGLSPPAQVPHTLWACNGRPLLSMAVIQYNGSEEELMDSIEREFS